MKFAECHILQGFNVNFTNMSRQNGVKNGKFRANFTLLGGGAERLQLLGGRSRMMPGALVATDDHLATRWTDLVGHGERVFHFMGREVAEK